MLDNDLIGRIATSADIVAGRDVRALAATLDIGGVAGARGDLLPPLWHWMLFQDWKPTERLGVDGHPERGGFLPPFHHLRRRMWAGGEVTFHAPLRIGDAVTRTTRIQSVVEKNGRSGPLAFITLRHEVSGPAGHAISERQDIVFRNGEAVTPSVADAGMLAGVPTTGGITQEVRCTPALLFRYSALTGNSHRIHYDQEYARAQEGYPDLLVQLPLQATLLSILLHRIEPGQTPTGFSFRARRPAFSGRMLTMRGWRERDRVHLRCCGPDDQVCVEAEARFNRPSCPLG